MAASWYSATRPREKGAGGARAKRGDVLQGVSYGPLTLAITDAATGAYLEVNENFTLLSGYRREEALGATSIGLGVLTAEERERLVSEVRTKGRVSGMELTSKRKNGDHVLCRYFVEPIALSGEQRFLSIVEDVSDRKKTERRQELANRVIENAQQPEPNFRIDAPRPPPAQGTRAWKPSASA